MSTCWISELSHKNKSSHWGVLQLSRVLLSTFKNGKLKVFVQLCIFAGVGETQGLLGFKMLKNCIAPLKALACNPAYGWLMLRCPGFRFRQGWCQLQNQVQPPQFSYWKSKADLIVYVVPFLKFHWFTEW